MYITTCEACGTEHQHENKFSMTDTLPCGHEIYWTVTHVNIRIIHVTCRHCGRSRNDRWSIVDRCPFCARGNSEIDAVVSPPPQPDRSSRPATAKQIAFLHNLGVTNIPENLSVEQASEMIDANLPHCEECGGAVKHGRCVVCGETEMIHYPNH